MDKQAGLVTSTAKNLLGWLKAPAKHFSDPISGAAAKIAREEQYTKHPEIGSIVGFILPKKIKTPINKFIRHVDERLGQLVSNPTRKKETVIEKVKRVIKGKEIPKPSGIFVKKEMVPDLKHKGRFIEHFYPSITAPVGKVAVGATPILGALYVAEKLDKLKKSKEADKLGLTMEQYEKYTEGQEKQAFTKEGHMDQKDSILVPRKELEKTAAALKKVKEIKEKSDGLEKKAQLQERAEKVAFMMVEMGAIPAFKSYDQFHEKVASLMEENLDVVEKALQLNTQKLASLGELSNRSVGNNALEQFVMEE